MLDIWLELLRRNGINEVLINLHAHSQLVRDHLNSANRGLAIRFSEEPTLLGSAGTIWTNRSWVASERIGLRGPVHTAKRGGVPMKMVLRPLMVGNDHLFGRGVCVEQTLRPCWHIS